MIIDAHTHHTRADKLRNHIAVVMDVHALGIHPWKLTLTSTLNDWHQELLKIESKADEFFLIGECGIDRCRSGLLEIQAQRTILEWHIDLAIKLQKPLVIHCVRAHSDLMQILHKRKNLPPLMLHDFTGNQYQIKEFCRYPVTFSLGKRFLKRPDLLKQIPSERLLLETDDQKETDIFQLYKEAAAILQKPLSEVEEQLEKNFLALFKHADNICTPDFIHNFN